MAEVCTDLCARGFFSCCLRRKLSDEAAVVTSGFFSRSSRSRLRRQTTGKKPSGIQGIVPASFAVQCVQRKTHLSKYYKETCARNFSFSYPFCTKHPHGKNFDRVGGTCLENFACLWKYPATRLVFGTYVKTERLKKLKSLPRGLMVLKYS